MSSKSTYGEVQNDVNRKQSKYYVVMTTAAGGTKLAIAFDDERDACDVAAA